jgi:hypothetical protein
MRRSVNKRAQKKKKNAKKITKYDLVYLFD